MKRIAAILLALCMLALAGFALAEQPVQRSGALAAYVDGQGHLFLPGNTKAINTANANTLVSIDPYRVLFTSEQADGTSDLYMIDLGTFAETRIVRGVHAAAMADEDTLYYVPAAQRTQLWRMSMTDMTPKLAYTETEPIDRLMNTAEGLVYDRVDGMGSMIYVATTDTFQRYARTLPAASLLTDSCELTLTDGELTMRDAASLAEEHIDSGVLTFAEMDGKIYYLANTGSAVRLKGYDPEAMTWQVVLTLDPEMDRQLTASAGKLFMMGYGNIYTVNLEKGSLELFPYQPKASYTGPEGYTFDGFKLYGMDGQLNLYAEFSEGEPTFGFIEFTSTSDVQAKTVRLLESWPIDGEEPAWTFLKPAVQYSPLSRGSRGDAVRAIQQPLYDLGYYDYYIDGIFGPRTQYAVELLQADLNRRVTGVADSELQRMLLEGKLPHYDAYMALTRGNRGMRVQIMQERLRELGYLADAADGVFGANTQRAVQRFQSENDLNVSDGATRETLKQLYSDGAAQCSSYIDLYKGYTGYRVRELNNRLQELYYLEDNPGSTYTAATVEAVKAFQRRAGLAVNGNATEAVQRKLFSRYAPEAPGYITLQRGDENDRVEALQRRLKELGYYTGSISGYYGSTTEKAVKLFQRKVDLSVTGVATVRTQQLLFRNDAPEYVPPTVIGDPVITVKPYEYKDGGVYYIADDTSDNGYITFSWYAEGEVESYRVRIKDEGGETLFDEETLLSRTGVSISTLEYNNVYTMTVTAYPEDGDTDHVTSSRLRFARIEPSPEPVFPAMGDVETPEITLETVTRVQDGIQYVATGKVVMRWHAEGEVDHYYVEVLDSNGDSTLTLTTTDENATMKSSAMAVGETYTLFVYAIPTGGELEDASVNAELFALEDASIPTPTPDPLDEEEEPAPNAPDEVPGDEQSGEVPADDAQAPEVTPAPEIEETPEEEEAPEQEEAPEEDKAADNSEEEAEPVITLEPVLTAPQANTFDVAEPAISFETVADSSDDVTFVAPGIVTMGWFAEGDVAGYEVFVTNENGDVVAHATTEKNSLSVKSENLTPGELYTLNVTAIPNGGTADDGPSASAGFALYLESEPELPEAPVVEAPAEQPAEQPETHDEALAEPYSEAVEDAQPVQQAEEVYVEGDNEKAPAEKTYDEVEDESYYDEEDYVESDDEAYVDEDYNEANDEAYDQEEYVEEQSYSEEEDYVEEENNDESSDDEYASEADVTAETEGPAPSPITPDADPETIGQLQMRLVGWGWLEDGSFETGMLDDATLQAVRSFQSWYNENYNGELPPAGESVDAATAALLMNQDGEVYARD